MDEIEVYAVGLVHASVCALSSLPVEAVVESINRTHPTGVTPWQLDEAGEFKDGTPMPCPCNQHEGRTHYLLTC